MNEKQSEEMQKLFLVATTDKVIKTNRGKFEDLKALLSEDLQIFNLMKLVRKHLIVENQRRQYKILDLLEFFTFNLDKEVFYDEINRKSFLQILNDILVAQTQSKLLKSKILHLVHLWKVFFSKDLRHQNFQWYFQLLVNNQIQFPGKCRSQYFNPKKSQKQKFLIDEKLFKPKSLKLFKDLQILSQNILLANLLISNNELSAALNVAFDLAEKQPKLEMLKE